jgi:hypothetical protein
LVDHYVYVFIDGGANYRARLNFVESLQVSAATGEAYPQWRARNYHLSSLHHLLLND